MEEIITNEFIAYKAGFVDGKCELITQVFENEGTDDFVKETFTDEEESWYSRGYEDGYDYYLNEYLQTREMPVNESRTKENEVLKNCFAKRIVDFNQSNNKEVPVAKFRI